jgi:hypothetical protein
MVILRILKEKNISRNYLSWMNNKKIQRFTEQKYKKHTFKDLKEFIETKRKSKTDFLFGIFLKKNNEHVGNIKFFLLFKILSLN